MSTGALIAAAFGIGFCTGLRCMTPVCVLALMRVPVTGFFASALYWPGHAYVFVAAAVGELIGDKLPNCPSRLAPLGLTARVLLSAFCGGALANCASAAVWLGAVLGVAGALAGAFAGNRYRGAVPKWFAFAAALAEDAVAIGGSILIASYFA